MQNRETGHINRHTLYVADSGGGKSQALMQNPEIPSRGARVVLFDPNEDHPWCLRYYQIDEYRRAIVEALRIFYRTKRGFRVAYCGEQTPEIHEEWCRIIFQYLDGRYLTYIIDEELGGSTRGAGMAEHHHGILINQSRKGGGIYHATAQKTEEIPKTVYSQCKEFWVGAVDPTTAAKLAKKMPVEMQKLIEQPDLSFHVYSKHRLGREPISTQLEYKDPKLIGRTRLREHKLKAA